ncbi:MAG TPA: tetratricopeptide repeat protein [Acidobacteriota bacterium]|nr:tetratricopeptide repeat protein [Acidobacteriota bacterium]
MRFDDYVRLALDDFRPSLLPVPLVKGLDRTELEKLRRNPVAAARDAAAAPGKFPVLVLGQGLFYESPFSHFVLCEYLASHGYVVATSPLFGTRYRLVNITIEDVETETRDMEFVAAEARNLPFADPGRFGVIGYDLGGMAGLILAMRNPEVAAFLSLDSGILDKHHSGLPAAHPQYREDAFRIPWMHMTQARFVRSGPDRSEAPSLYERKAGGPSYLVHVPTTSHGQFSSYAALGLTAAVPAYWGAQDSDPKPAHEEICRLSLAFFDASLKRDDGPLRARLGAAAGAGSPGPGFRIESKAGRACPPAESELVDLIIEKGPAAAGPAIARARAAFPDVPLISEPVLEWLGLHFLYWWGREDDAVGVFELGVSLAPKSPRAYGSLGDAYEARGRKNEAILSFKKALELDPNDQGAKAALERLAGVKKDGGA